MHVRASRECPGIFYTSLPRVCFLLVMRRRFLTVLLGSGGKGDRIHKFTCYVETILLANTARLLHTMPLKLKHHMDIATTILCSMFGGQEKGNIL